MKIQPTYEVTSEIAHMIWQVRFAKRNPNLAAEALAGLDQIEQHLVRFELDKAASACSELKGWSPELRVCPDYEVRVWQATLYEIIGVLRDGDRYGSLRERIERAVRRVEGCRPTDFQSWVAKVEM